MKFKASFTNLFLKLFLLVSFSGVSQDYVVEKVPNRYRLSWETVSMSEEPDLGFVGIGFDLFSRTHQSTERYFGITSYSTMQGIRPGLITLGVSSGLRTKLFESGLFLDLGGFVGGGGGGAADDGGGLIVRPHLFVEKRLGNLGLHLGVSRIDFPTGNISGNQLHFGLSLQGDNYFKTKEIASSAIEISAPRIRSFRFGLVGTRYFQLQKGSDSDKATKPLGTAGLVGIQIEKRLDKYWHGVFKTNGAFQGGIDGYMSILVGMGGRYALVNEGLSLKTNLLFGPSGGGAIKSGGGAIAQAEVGFSLRLKNDYDLQLMTGKTWSPWGDFTTNHFELSLGKSFELLAPTKLPKGVTHFKVPASDYSENHLSFATFNRTYFSSSKALDKSGRPYLTSFQLLGFEVQKHLNDRFRLHGGTVWAYQGDYGAYAEGLLGATYSIPFYNHWEFVTKAVFGAAGGGNINLGSGLLFQYAIGIERILSPKSNVYVHFGKVNPLEGNFTPYSLDFGFKFQLHQLLKK